MKQTFSIPMPTRYIINAVVLVLFVVFGNMLIGSGVLPRAQQMNILQVGVFIILAVSLNLTTGYLGQLPLGHAGFMALGAYTAGLFWRAGVLPEGASLVGGLILAGIVAAAFGIAIGIPALRLRGDYLAIITLGFGEIIRILINNDPFGPAGNGVLYRLTGGALRTNGAMGLVLHRHTYSTFVVIFVCVILTCAVIHTLMKSRHGRAIYSIRENEIAAESCGIKTTYYKVLAFAVSAFFAGLAGALFAGITGYLEPAEFDFMTSINILMIVVIGGMGSMAGAVIGAAVLTTLPLVMQFMANWMMVFYAVILIAMMLFRPSGILGNYDFSLSRILEKFISRFKRGNSGKGDGVNG